MHTCISGRAFVVFSAGDGSQGLCVLESTLLLSYAPAPIVLFFDLGI
jgi:hypothetical protein